MGRSKKLNDEMREIRLEQIRAEALKQFSMKGLAATKIKDIAEGVNMSQGLIYHYYKSKNEIFLQIIESVLDEMNNAVDKVKSLDVKPHIKIEILIEGLLDAIRHGDEFGEICKLLSQAKNTDTIRISEDKQKKLLEKSLIPYFEIEKIIKEGQDIGKIVEGNPKELTVTFWTTLSGIAIYKTTCSTEVVIPDSKIIKRMFLK